MKVLRSISLASIVPIVCGATFAQKALWPPKLIRALVQAKSVYVVSGRVRFYKTKAFVKTIEGSP